MRQLITVLFLCLLSIDNFAQNYSAESIPKNLKSRASAIVRDESILIDMKNDANISEKVSRTVTILNKSGESYGVLSIYYNKGKSIKNISGFIYDEFGKQVKKFSTKDFSDYSASSQSNMYDDVRVKHYSPSINTFPYTIVFTYEIKHTQNLYVPYWTPNWAADIAVENSSYQFVCNPDQELRIKEENIPSPVSIETNGKSKTYTWKANNLPARKEEPLSPNELPGQIAVKIVPKDFQFFKKTGKAENWKELGGWVYEALLKDKNDLPESTKAKAREIAAKYDTDHEKAKALYQYLQHKTRYISIQVGIGGIEPFPASYVDRLGYGDCKALVNYMHALLSAVNIKSYYCVVQAGNRKIDLDKDFANIVDGNHIILCIPSEQDTTWLECTSNRSPFNYLGNFTDDRLVLACTPEGGKILRTPKYTAADSKQIRHATLNIDPSGTVTGSIRTLFSGTQFDNNFDHMDMNPTDLNKALKETYDIDNITFSNVKYQILDSAELCLDEKIDVSLKSYVVKNGNNIIIQPNVFNALRSIPDSRNRVNKTYINRGYTDIDEIKFVLSQKIKGDIAPTFKRLDCPMATYEVRVIPEGDTITFYRKIQLNEGTYSPEDYEKYYTFMKEVSSTDRGKYTLPLE